MLLHLVKKRLPDCKEICVDYAGGGYRNSASHALESAGVRRGNGLYPVRHFRSIHAVAVCFAERVSMPESVCPAVRCSISSKTARSVKVYFLYAYLCDLLPDFWN